jgi:hypothetical protein
MDFPDIICTILEILLDSEDARTILNCKYICKQWYSIIDKYSKKYINNKPVFTYKMRHNITFSRYLSDSILDMLRRCDFNNFLITRIRDHPGAVLEYILNLVPNEKINQLRIKNNTIVNEHVDRWITVFFNDAAIFEKTVDDLIDNRSEKVGQIYNLFYRKNNHLNKIACLFILINCEDDEIITQEKYNE